MSVFRARPLNGVACPDGVETGEAAWMSPGEVLALETHPTLAGLHRAVVENLEGGVFVVK